MEYKKEGQHIIPLLRGTKYFQGIRNKKQVRDDEKWRIPTMRK
jgi:hypothetical protein